MPKRSPLRPDLEALVQAFQGALANVSPNSTRVYVGAARQALRKAAPTLKVGEEHAVIVAALSDLKQPKTRRGARRIRPFLEFLEGPLTTPKDVEADRRKVLIKGLQAALNGVQIPTLEARRDAALLAAAC